MKDIFGHTIPVEIKPEICIEGMSYYRNWISQEEHDILIKSIDDSKWDSLLKRRVQQYGYKYDYRAAKNMVSSNKNNYLGELPEFLQFIAVRLFEQNIFQTKPDQVIINEYLPGQGIANHIDCLPCYNDTIVSLSLGSQCVMDLKSKDNTVHKLLEKNSLLVLQGESRYKWSHGIRTNSSDLINGKWIKRDRRISVTFRKTI